MSLGCNWLTPLIFVGEHKQKVAAEFDKLPNKRVLILAWVPPESLFDYPYVRFELASYVNDKLDTEMASRKLSIDLVNPREVEDYLQREMASQIDPQTVGRHFHADYVVYLEVLDFQIRDPEQPQLLQGLIHASLSVHEMSSDQQASRRYELAAVRSTYPDSSALPFSANNSVHVREMTYRTFAEQVARRFYDHTVDL